jgi:hypothetical protein
MAAGSMERGWSAYLTLHSRESNLTPEGRPRIHLNNPDLAQLFDELSAVFPPEWANFIVAYRQGGPVAPTNQAVVVAGTDSDPGQAQPIDGRQVDLSLPSQATFTQVLDLVEAQTRVRFAGESQPTLVQSPFIGPSGLYLPLLLDYATINPAPSIPGRININQAPACILRGIPGINDDIVDRILQVREPELLDERRNRRHETWLLDEGVVTLTEMKLLQPFICSGGDVYRAQVVGYFQSGQASARAEVIFDATGLLPRVVLWRDMSHLGRGYALETLGVDYSDY